MYHIKTDIRQYKCESEDKVERLIRNWVIRPSDLIFHADEEAWKPIGQHPDFNDIFEGIEFEETNEPDTVVTDPPSEIAAEHEVEPGAELEESDAEKESEDEKQTDELEASQESRDDESDEERETGASDEERETDEVEAEEDEQIVEQPEPPEPPDEVEGVARDSDEITLMTEETFDMMREGTAVDLSESSDLPQVDGAEEGEAATGRHGLPEEVFVTDEIPRQDSDEGLKQPEASARVDADMGADAPVDGDAKDDELDVMLDEAARLVGLDAVVDEPAASPPQDSETEESADPPSIEVEALPDPDELKREAYRVSLPIDISPSPEDIRLGLTHSWLDRRQKERVFPHPTPPENGRVVLRRFDLDAKPEPTESESDKGPNLTIVVGVAVALALIVILLVL